MAKIEKTPVIRRFETVPQTDFIIVPNKNGKIAVNVYTYFIKAGLPDIKKFFKLAKEYCTGEQRKQIINDLNTVKTFWLKEYNYIQYLMQNHSSITFTVLRPFIDFYPSTTKKSEKLQNKLDKVLALLKDSQWSDEVKKPIEEAVECVNLHQMS